jgi:ATP-dependent helicase HepA
MSAGRFVHVKGSRDGVGKVVRLDGTRAEVEYFVSPAAAEQRRRTVKVSDLVAVELSPQTRVYWYDEKHGAWRAGRVDGGLVSAQALRAKEDHYHVRFPNGLEARIPESGLHVRWSHPIEEPTDYLAARITDTPFYFEGRQRALQLIADERAAFGDLSGAASSAIELLEHQITIVRHVSADPIQRYLLADEVGLGKTIEAGILIRQHVIDAPRVARVLVLVPPHLVAQWRNELSQKFFVAETDGVQVASDIDPSFLQNPFTMLVVDEAHRIALSAFEGTPADRRRFESVRAVAASTPRLLLLSGTPVLHREDGFLAMLHLLDPDGYPLEQREAFRRRVQGRQTIAEAVADLGDDASSFFVEDALDRIEGLFTDDRRLADLCAEMRGLADADAADGKRLRALRSLRNHVSETYRLHRRLLRTRRDDPRVKDLLPRRVGALVLEHDCQARREAADFLDAWRAIAADTPGTEDVQRFAAFVEAALSHPAVLLRRIEDRLATLSHQRGKRRASTDLPSTLDAESSLLSERARLISDALGEDSRCRRLAQWLQESRETRKAVVFVDDRQVADSTAAQLSRHLRGVLRHGATPDAEEVFTASDVSRVLVCDASAEEGLNLQRIGAVVVHFDLPLDPARIEQRIGRVDRIEARKNVQSVVFSASSSYEDRWRRCLTDTVRVFERSVSPLQYVLIDETARLRAELLVEGVAALENAQSRMASASSGLEAEFRRIRAQELLDAVEFEPEAERALFERLQEGDARSEVAGADELDAWVVERLQFSRRDDDEGGFRYVHCAQGRHPTLLPLLETVERFGSLVDRDPRVRRTRAELPLRRVTFERAAAEEERLELLRVGHPFLDGMEAQIRADDRGAAFAMWRHLPRWKDEPRLFFLFSFVIEPELNAANDLVEEVGGSLDALSRRARRAFPCQYRRIWLDSDLNAVRSSEVLRALDLPYAKKPRPDGGTDANLRLERWPQVDALVPMGDWCALCVRARERAEALLRSDTDLRELCQRYARQMTDASARAEDTLRSRVARLDGAARSSEERAIEFDGRLVRLLARGIESPKVRADAVGAIFLAASPLGRP